MTGAMRRFGGQGFVMELLDLGIIDEVRDALGDEAYGGYAGRMLAEMHALAPVLNAQLDAEEFEALAQTAHRAAGSAVSVGAKGLHSMLKQIEDLARDEGASARLRPLLAEFPEHVRATEAALAALSG